MKPPTLFLKGMLGLSVLALVRPATAAPFSISPFERQDYDVATSSTGWAEPPGESYRLYLDVYNAMDFFDSETRNTANFTDQTLLADTLRPTLTLLWNDRARIEIGVIAERKFGNDVGYQPVAPWIQLLWQPVKPLSVILGDLDTPHYFLPAVFYYPNYVLPLSRKVSNIPAGQYTDYVNHPFETGMQLVLKQPWLYDDLAFNYEQLDTNEHNEKFTLGFVHRNHWKWLYLNYQAHWVHNGGELVPSAIETRNDVAQAAGPDIEFHPFHIDSLIVGGGYTYLHSHLRQDSNTPSFLVPSTNGNGDLWQAFIRWSRIKLTYGDWHGHQYQHEGGDLMYTLPHVNIANVHWDILLSPHFNLYIDDTQYFLTDDSNGYNRYVKTAVYMEAAWQFSIPLLEWTTGNATAEPLNGERWDEGL